MPSSTLTFPIKLTPRTVGEFKPCQNDDIRVNISEKPKRNALLPGLTDWPFLTNQTQKRKNNTQKVRSQTS